MDKLPKNAKLVFKGVIYEVWQWEQELYDGSITTFEALKRADSVIVIPVVGDKILILDEEQPNRPPFISLPAGRADQSDNMLAEAKRELVEETGYTSADWQLWKSADFASTLISQVHFFIARNCQPTQSATPDRGEKISMRLVTFEDFLILSENPTFRLREMREWLLRMQLHPQERDAFHHLLFS